MTNFKNKRADLRRKKKSKSTNFQNIHNGDRILETGSYGNLPFPEEMVPSFMRQLKKAGLFD